MSGSSIDNSYSNLSSATTPYTQTTALTISDKMEFEKVNGNANEVSDNSSLIQIQKLNEIEKKIGELLKVASQAISVLSGDEDESIKVSFEDLTVQYLELVNDIQKGLRETFRFLTNTDIESTSFTTGLPYISNTYGEEKDQEISVKVLELVKTKINTILNAIGDSMPLANNLSSSSISSGTSNINIPTGLNNKFLNSRYTSNAELIASSLCSSNNNSNANIKVDDELANDIAFFKKPKVKKEAKDLMDIDNKKIIKSEEEKNNTIQPDEIKKDSSKDEERKKVEDETIDFLNFNKPTDENTSIDDLDLDF
ncbi:hypothetical protein BCR36DRAFT_333562 [Piromyces finnis]|uniref:Mediator of RNA polymerase II transcription subunit 11 n=1 Tax=Piromyces finnis TaxID=1754191 RepID=A0A1Y1V3R4_9FUNG|nr:hypothetical protein BCR36DRAFT_333562 [Piromyces finnis]|eukprot:ORX45217.1 hypothetical protein BCR36DRAFT_333562 [Piromyces finnis]